MSVKRTVRKDTGAISLKRQEVSNGKYLLYVLKVWGAQGVFSLVDDKERVLMKNTDFPAPQQEYTRRWPKATAEIPSEDDVMHTLAISFITATKYSYQVEMHSPDGSLSLILKDIDFESTDPADNDYNGLRIFLVH